MPQVVAMLQIESTRSILLGKWIACACPVPSISWPDKTAMLFKFPAYFETNVSRCLVDKSLILGQVQTIKNNYALSQACIALLAFPDARERLNEAFSLPSVKEYPETQSIRYIDYIFEDDELFKLATMEFRKSILINCMKEIFELVKKFGTETDQVYVIESAPWYQFLRIVRNCLSHDMTLLFSRLLKNSWRVWS